MPGSITRGADPWLAAHKQYADLNSHFTCPQLKSLSCKLAKHKVPAQGAGLRLGIED